MPGDAYNPLFLHAPPGLGKTHLLHAIGNYVHAFGGGASVRYTTAEDFTNHFMGALSTKAVEPFKRAYRDADVLLIDDIQFLAEQGAHRGGVLPHLQRAARRTAGSSSSPATACRGRCSGIEARLRERFEAGLVAEIAPPDLATRITILRKRAALDAITIDDPAVLELVAARVDQQHPRARGRPDPRRRPQLTHPAPPRPRARRPRSWTASTPERRGGRTPTIAAVQAVVAAHFSISRRGAHLRRAEPLAIVVAPADGHPSRARAHRCLPPGHRRRLRGPQPRHRAARLQACRRACRR